MDKSKRLVHATKKIVANSLLCNTNQQIEASTCPIEVFFSHTVGKILLM